MSDANELAKWFGPDGCADRIRAFMDSLKDTLGPVGLATLDEAIATLDASRAKVAALEAELKTIRENGLNVLRLSVDEAKQPYVALGLAKERITALEADVARLTREREEAKDRGSEMRHTMGGLANNLADARERIARLEAALREAIRRPSICRHECRGD